jgi:signal transduction histidine kinase
MAVVILVAVSPLIFVWGSDVVDRDVGERMLARVELAGERAGNVVAGRHAQDEIRLTKALDTLSRRHDVRIRVIDARGATLHDLGAEGGLLRSDLAETLFFGPDGAPSLWEYDATQPAVSQREEVQEALRGMPVSGCRASAERKLLICHAAVRVNTADGPVVVYTQESSRRAIRALYDVRYQVFKLTLFNIILGVLLALWLGWRLVQPLEALRDQVVQRTAAQTGRRAPIQLDRDDEFGDLAKAFNALLAHLEARNHTNEAFAADLVHELKNPLAAIRAVGEQIEGGAPLDPARSERLARALRGSSQRLQALVESFLELARAEAGMPGEDRGPVDLHALLHGVVGSMVADPHWAGVAFTAPDVGADATVQGVTERLETVLRNLLENAAAFAGEGGAVVAQIDVREHMARITISDSGPGIETEDLPRVFDRFFSRRTEADGTGLGLAIATAIATAHGGTISAASPADGGAEFTVTLPLDPG